MGFKKGIAMVFGIIDTEFATYIAIILNIVLT